MNRPTRIYFLGLLLACAAALVVERLIVTDREAIEALAEELAATLQAEDYERLGGLLDPSFTLGPRDREASIAYVRSAMRKYRPLGIELQLQEIEIQGDTATCAAEVAALVYGRPQRTLVSATFSRSEGGWLLSGIDDVEPRLRVTTPGIR